MRRLVLPLCHVRVGGSPAASLRPNRFPLTSDGSLAGTREIGISATGRVLSTAYSVPDGRSAIGGAVSATTHINSHFAVQGALGIAYSKQENTYYKPPLVAFTPTLSVIASGIHRERVPALRARRRGL